MGWWEDLIGGLTGTTQRDAANEALDRSQAATNAGKAEATTYQQNMLAQLLKQYGMSNDQINAFIKQAMSSVGAAGEGMISQARTQAANQVAGQQGINDQQMGMFNRQQAENAPQLAANNQMLQALQGRMLGLAGGTGTFQPTALYNTQLAEMNKLLGNAFAARGLGNSSAAITGLREGQNKLMATDQQQQFTNLTGMYNQLMNRNFSTIDPRSVSLNNPYANLTNISGVMQNNVTNQIPFYQAQANQAGLYGQQQAQAQTNYGQNMTNLATGNAANIAGIAQRYGNVPQGGIWQGITNAAGLYKTVQGVK